MTYSVPRTSAVALGVAAFVSLSALSAARADSSADPAPTPIVTAPAHPTSAPTPAPTSAAAPSLNEPAPTPAWAESGPHRDDGRSEIRRSGATPTPATHIATGIATTATTLSRLWRWERLAAPPIWVRSPPIRSIASRTTAPVRSVCRIGTERALLFSGHKSTRRSPTAWCF